MRRNKALAFLILIPLILMGCTIAPSQDTGDNGTLVIGEVYTLENGKSIDGNLVVVGSSFTMEEGSRVLGDISLIGSTTQISGQIDGDVFAFAGSSTLESSGVIHGDLNQVFHKLIQRDGSTISGEISTFSNPQTIQPVWSGFNIILPYISSPEKIITSRLVLSAVFLFLASLIVYLLPKQTQNVMHTLYSQPGVSWGRWFLGPVRDTCDHPGADRHDLPFPLCVDIAGCLDDRFAFRMDSSRNFTGKTDEPLVLLENGTDLADFYRRTTDCCSDKPDHAYSCCRIPFSCPVRLLRFRWGDHQPFRQI